ncbi:DUF983 domain-containing protein [Tropicimonas isoalkanivorans]|uniref:Uncharacterized conserved protein, DUF983 family n=1 Tax=Tropicimonas isoalkanivorans TaxID=441112 RepID=A0A1I1LBA3_9RHOB|nr:DUF983 domain-containing protein [Tropicimonas isoalkanivorans]SFC70266.1 Uncharacterized conserved protein, DUF983 family [Tropicimonas isoalkanivorans]
MTYPDIGSPEDGDWDERPLKPALRRGWRRRCPNCGNGPLFAGYLKVADHCPVCEEPFHFQRADDGPAYLTILIVGHAMVPLIMLFYEVLHLDPLIMASALTVICVALSLYLLPRIKGAFVALQWSRRMHGFGGPDDRAER